MKTIVVNASKKYEVLIENGLLNLCGELTAKVKKPCKAFIISDDIVFPLYGEQVKKSYENAGFEIFSYAIKNGEKSKTMQTVVTLLDNIANAGLSRGDIIIALGGGVVGDLAGFAAAIYLRGIDFVQIPTTFLAAIDSSVGGKTGADLPSGKNQVGVFHQPILVLCDIDTFKTLSPQIFADGICEALKYGVICDEELFDIIAKKDIHENVLFVVERCVSIKRDIVLKDEFDTGERMLLNLGHTIGHCVESLSDYKISHGNAVGIGMVYIAKICEKANIAEPCSQKIKSALEKYGVNCECNYLPSELANKAMADKKRNANSISLVLIEKIGRSFIRKMPIDELEDFISLGAVN